MRSALCSSRDGSARCGAPFSCTHTSSFGKPLDERAGRAGVVEMDVRQEQRLGLVLEAVQQRLDAALGPGIDQRRAQLPAADHALAPEMADVDQPWLGAHDPA